MRAHLVGIAITSMFAHGCGGKVIFDVSTGGAGGTGAVTSHAASVSVTHASGSTATATSSKASSTGTGAICPDPLPIEGSCSFEGQACPVLLSCCGDSAECLGGFWTFPGPSCQADCAADCGPNGFACGGGAVCVAYIGNSTTYECRPQPCKGPLDCSCADALCTEQGMTCNNIQDGTKVLCD